MEAHASADEATAGQVGLLGALATAGIAALAYEHEVAKQLELLRDVGMTLRRISKGPLQQKLTSIAQQIDEWVERAQGTRSLFVPLLDEQNRTLRGRFPAKEVVETIAKQTTPILRGARIETVLIDQWLRLPRSGMIEWNAIFQNVFVNAVNAMAEIEEKIIRVSSRKSGKRYSLLIQDKGCGVNLASSNQLFEPFVRKTNIPISQRAFGLGGSGLGLTIVRMVAGEIKCEVAFIKPEDGFSTCLEVSWRET